MEDAASGALRVDNNQVGALPSVNLQTFRKLFYKRLRPLLLSTAVTALTPTSSIHEVPVAVAHEACSLLTAVLHTVVTAGTLGVREN
jgi:hypothetical protein